MGKRLLLVEGKNDEHVVKHLCRGSHGIIIRSATENLLNEDDRRRIFLWRYRRKTVGAQVPIRLKESDLEGLAVVLDANEDALNLVELRCETDCGSKVTPRYRICRPPKERACPVAYRRSDGAIGWSG